MSETVATLVRIVIALALLIALMSFLRWGVGALAANDRQLDDTALQDQW